MSLITTALISHAGDPHREMDRWRGIDTEARVVISESYYYYYYYYY